MPRENKTRYALLGMLTYKPMSGYDMKKMSDHSIGHFWNENYGNIYPVLKTMEAEGLVVMSREGGEDSPAKKVYTITQQGRKEFESWLKRPALSSKLRDELLLQIFFGQWTDRSVIVEKLNAEDARCAAVIEVLEGIRAHMDSGESMDPDYPVNVREIMIRGRPYWRSTVEFGLNYYTGIRKWCAETIANFKEL